MLRFKIKAECSKPVNLTTHFVFTVAAENKKIQQGNSVVHVNSFNWRTAAASFFFIAKLRGKDPLTESRDTDHVTCSDPRKGKGEKKKKKKASVPSGSVWHTVND